MTRRLRATIGGLALFSALLAPGVAGAADDYVGGDAKVKGNDTARPQVDADDDDRGLPITGGDVAGLTAIGLASVAVGTTLVRRSRRTA